MIITRILEAISLSLVAAAFAIAVANFGLPIVA